ncbi:PHP domain-containing protein [Mycoplasma bradburyae]|uniref:PHP domain-containing protein n=1 Tax=Mycoplasma bradburyae TaxID=2963128 RepID=UPI0023420772|nr:PHP domain-containing protein [Mycoplasma bradburyae]MDC4182630.1 PHP domain-containing protein [Mycoplasma bradburyae]
MSKQIVDLHIHSHNSMYIGEKQVPKTIFSGDKYLSTLKENNVRAFSFTDHDTFSDAFYFELQDLISKIDDYKISIFPGVEFRIKSKNRIKGADCNFVFDNQLSKERIQELSRLVSKLQSRKHGADIKTLVKHFSNANYVFFIIPDVGKSGSCSYEDFQDVIEYVKYVECDKNNSNRLSNLIKQGLDIDYKQVFFSDCHNINNYHLKPSKTLINVNENKIIDFEDLKNLLFIE